MEWAIFSGLVLLWLGEQLGGNPVGEFVPGVLVIGIAVMLQRIIRRVVDPGEGDRKGFHSGV